MSIDIIKQQVNKFLESDTPEVIAISGAWGVGKTYTWNKLLKEAQINNKISLKKYAYVSLFGISSLKDFKDAIFINTINNNQIGKEANLETFKENLLDRSKILNISSSFTRSIYKISNAIPFFKKYLPKSENIAFLSAYECLICIDDIERRGPSLDIGNVLGLVSQLIEQKKCKVVLLLNDDHKGLKEYKKYHEKVIDIGLKFVPTAAESASIAYDGESDTYNTLRELTEKLNITNIRVLKKIEKIVNLAQSYMINYEDEVKHQFLCSLTLFTWCHYRTNNIEIPTLDFVTNLNSYQRYDTDESKDESDQHKQWKTLLEHYGYRYTDELDLVLAEAVRTGYFIEKKLRSAAMKVNEQIIASKSEGSFRDAWSLYHDTFENNQDEVINGLYDSFKCNVNYISPADLDVTVKLFRDLEESGKASELINFYVNSRNTEIDLFNIKKNNHFEDNPDQEIVKKFQEAFLKSAITESAKQVLERIAGRNSWNPEDEVILANTTADEFYNLFKSEKGPHLFIYIKFCLHFGKISGPDYEQRLQIMKGTQDALLKIAGESKINRRRISRRYGIKIEEGEN